LIRERFDLVEAVQQIVVLLHLALGKLATNKDNVGQNFRLVNVTKGFPHFHESFATLDMSKLVVHQVEADDGHGLLNASLVLLQHFGIYNGK
jgi:hypothetical protein